MSLYSNRIYHRDRFEAFDRISAAELEAVQAGQHSGHVLAFYFRRGAGHWQAWRALVLADAEASAVAA